VERREAVLRACSLEVAESPIARVEKPAGKRVSEKGKGDDRERFEAQTHLLNKVDRSVSSPQSRRPAFAERAPPQPSRAARSKRFSPSCHDFGGSEVGEAACA